jgi:hypothetical protein
MELTSLDLRDVFKLLQGRYSLSRSELQIEVGVSNTRLNSLAQGSVRVRPEEIRSLIQIQIRRDPKRHPDFDARLLWQCSQNSMERHYTHLLSKSKRDFIFVDGRIKDQWTMQAQVESGWYRYSPDKKRIIFFDKDKPADPRSAHERLWDIPAGTGDPDPPSQPDTYTEGDEDDMGENTPIDRGHDPAPKGDIAEGWS